MTANGLNASSLKHAKTNGSVAFYHLRLASHENHTYAMRPRRHSHTIRAFTARMTTEQKNTLNLPRGYMLHVPHFLSPIRPPTVNRNILLQVHK